MDKKFERVNLDKFLRADVDDMPVFRKCFEHEILMSFYDDDGAYEFEDWWNAEGSVLFYKFLENKDSWLTR
jgi:hypothetical protein